MAQMAPASPCPAPPPQSAPHALPRRDHVFENQGIGATETMFIAPCVERLVASVGRLGVPAPRRAGTVGSRITAPSAARVH